MRATYPANFDLSAGSFDKMFVQINDINYLVTWDSTTLSGTFKYKSATHSITFADMMVTIVITEEDKEISSTIKKIGVQVDGFIEEVSILPKVTEEDDGKVLMVVDGVWDKNAIDRDVYILEINYEYDNYAIYTSPLSYDEVEAKIEDGIVVIAHVDPSKQGYANQYYNVESWVHGSTINFICSTINRSDGKFSALKYYKSAPNNMLRYEEYLDQTGISINNIQDGTQTGSVRTVGSTNEDSNYKLGMYAFAEGYSTKAQGLYSHAEGSNTVASGMYSHAEGSNTVASGTHSHAEGQSTNAYGNYSHAEGLWTIANSELQHVQGEFNIPDPANATPATRGTYAFIIGNGTKSSNRSNAFAMKWDGTFVFANGTEITPDQFASMVNGEGVVSPLIVKYSGIAENELNCDTSFETIVNAFKTGTPVIAYLWGNNGNYIKELQLDLYDGSEIRWIVFNAIEEVLQISYITHNVNECKPAGGFAIHGNNS